MRLAMILLLGIFFSSCDLSSDNIYNDLPNTNTWEKSTEATAPSTSTVAAKSPSSPNAPDLKFVILPLAPSDEGDNFRSILYLLIDTELFPVAECPFPFVDNLSRDQLREKIGATYNLAYTLVGCSAHDSQSELIYWVDLFDNVLSVRAESKSGSQGILIQKIELDDFTSAWLEEA